MHFLTCLLLLPGQIETKDSADFPKQIQVRAVTATVRIHNPAKKSEGSGVIVGRSGPFVYILTADHTVAGAEQLDITTFSEQSYPKADKVYREAKVVAKSGDLRDLALVRMVCNDTEVGMLPLCPLAEAPKGKGFSALTSGCAEGQAPTALIEKVLGKREIRRKAGEESSFFWELENAVVKGRSGGPLVDKRGYVVGICSGTSDGKGYYTHPQEIHRFLKQHVFDWLADKE
jgi:S1-C subfamily serine protease